MPYSCGSEGSERAAPADGKRFASVAAVSSRRAAAAIRSRVAWSTGAVARVAGRMTSASAQAWAWAWRSCGPAAAGVAAGVFCPWFAGRRFDPLLDSVLRCASQTHISAAMAENTPSTKVNSIMLRRNQPNASPTKRKLSTSREAEAGRAAPSKARASTQRAAEDGGDLCSTRHRVKYTESPLASSRSSASLATD